MARAIGETSWRVRKQLFPWSPKSRLASLTTLLGVATSRAKSRRAQLTMMRLRPEHAISDRTQLYGIRPSGRSKRCSNQSTFLNFLQIFFCQPGAISTRPRVACCVNFCLDTSSPCRVL